MAKQTIQALERAQCDFIVSGSASCVAMIMQDYIHLFRNDPGWQRRAESLWPARCVDFTTFLDNDRPTPAGSLLGRARRSRSRTTTPARA